jgi:hypothetical protein
MDIVQVVLKVNFCIENWCSTPPMCTLERKGDISNLDIQGEIDN